MRKSRQRRGSQRKRCSINLQNLLSPPASHCPPIRPPHTTYILFSQPSVTTDLIYCPSQSFSSKKEAADFTWMSTGLSSRLAELECSLPGQSYVRLGTTGSHSSTVQVSAPIVRSQTRLYFQPDSAKGEDNVCCCSPLLDVFYICRLPQHGSRGCKIYLGQSYYVSALVPCLSSLGVQRTFTPFISIQRMFLPYVWCVAYRKQGGQSSQWYNTEKENGKVFFFSSTYSFLSDTFLKYTHPHSLPVTAQEPDAKNLGWNTFYMETFDKDWWGRKSLSLLLRVRRQTPLTCRPLNIKLQPEAQTRNCRKQLDLLCPKMKKRKLLHHQHV